MPIYPELNKCYSLNLEIELLKPELSNMLLKYRYEHTNIHKLTASKIKCFSYVLITFINFFLQKRFYRFYCGNLNFWKINYGKFL